jgi:putative transposase
MKGLAQALNFGKSVSDNGWGMFVGMLSYKLSEQGKYLIVIDKWFPSSKKCSCCGRVKDILPLAERTFVCSCGFVRDRDINAACNIRDEGVRIIDAFAMNRGTHGDRSVNILPIGGISQEAPTSTPLAYVVGVRHH